MQKTLVVTEKPGVAQSIAAVLGAKQRRDGYIESSEWLISWCYGHLVELAPVSAYGEQYKRWSLDTLPILPDIWKYTASDGKSKQLAVLHELMNRSDVDCIVCATDSGREGELIYRLVYDYCHCNKPTKRLWISSMEDEAIRDGFKKLRPGSDFDRLYKAALCRAKADYMVGINGTRLFSCLYGCTLNVGRVQSPTLALIVGRELEVCRFISKPFYTPEINCGEFAAYGEKFKDFGSAEAVRAAAGRDAVVISVDKQRKSAAPPKIFDLTALQREANRLLGYTAQQTLDYAQSLYEKKLITYPRSDSRYLTSGMEAGIPALVKASAAILPFSVGDDLPLNTSAVINDAGERDILFMIAVRLICAVGDKHDYETVSAVLECGGHKFTASGKTVISDGWRTADNSFRSMLKNKQEENSEEDGAALPEIANGQVFEAVTASVKEGKTSPPRRYTEDTLLSAMENAGAQDFPGEAERRGLGTPSTRASTIEKLIKSGFVERQKRYLYPTTKGVNFTAVLPENIRSPILTAEWEQKLSAVQKGELSDIEFIDGIASLTRELVTAHREPEPEYADLFASPPKGEIIGRCVRCGSVVTEKNKGFFCGSRACKFVLWKSNRFFEAKKKKLDKQTAAALLAEGRVFFSDLYSAKTGKTYAASILLEDDGANTNYILEFEKNERGGGRK